MSNGETLPWPVDDDTTRETAIDIGEMPTLRWVRIAEKADPAPATLRWGSGTTMGATGTGE